MGQMIIKMMCLRCRRPFGLKPGYLVDFCETCRRVTGTKMVPERQAQMNKNWAIERDILQREAIRRGNLKEHSPFMQPDGTKPFTFVGKQFGALWVPKSATSAANRSPRKPETPASRSSKTPDPGSDTSKSTRSASKTIAAKEKA